MTQKKSKTLVASAVSLALSSMMLSAGLNAGIIDDTNVTGYGAWNLDNVVIKKVNAETGAVIDTIIFDPLGNYTPALSLGETFVSEVYSDATLTTLVGKITGKDWPVGEPTGIKAVNDDQGVINKADGSPENCIINTAYLEGAYLDSATPKPVICSSPFQSHKRFKVAMQPATTAGVADGAYGNPVDLVFNIADEDADGATVNLRRYQVFSKINNYTDKRLKGYKIQVGTMVNGVFQAADVATADRAAISDRLKISLGFGEALIDDDKDPLTPPIAGDLFDAEGLATFSRGLFGPMDTTHTPPRFPTDGFFDERYAGFNVTAGCAQPCTSDSIYSTGTMDSNYIDLTNPTNTLFGQWLPSIWAPSGIFFDTDGDPATDAELVAWWNGSNWLKGEADNFAVVTQAELEAFGADPAYSIGIVEDVLNLGIGYIVEVGDDLDLNSLTANSTFVIRIIPEVADTVDQVEPAWVASPAPALPTTTTPPPAVTTSDDGGGCTIGGSGRFDPTLPALLAAGLGFFGWRRFKNGK